MLVKIQLYQKKNGIEDTDGICFHRNERAVVLRKLYVSTKSRKRKKRRKKKASTKRKVEKK